MRCFPGDKANPTTKLAGHIPDGTVFQGEISAYADGRKVLAGPLGSLMGTQYFIKGYKTVVCLEQGRIWSCQGGGPNWALEIVNYRELPNAGFYAHGAPR